MTGAWTSRMLDIMICDDGVEMPRRATKGSAGYDICAPVRLVLNRTEWTAVDLGFRFEEGDIPEGHVALVQVRSSLGMKKGVHLRNGFGIIDSDYRDNVRASLSSDKDEVILNKGDRILQFIIVPFATMPGEIPPSEERSGGIGSTGQRGGAWKTRRSGNACMTSGTVPSGAVTTPVARNTPRMGGGESGSARNGAAPPTASASPTRGTSPSRSGRCPTAGGPA